MENFDEWLTISDIARKIKRSRAWAHKLRERGEFPNARFINGIYIIPPTDFSQYQERRQLKQGGLK